METVKIPLHKLSQLGVIVLFPEQFSPIHIAEPQSERHLPLISDHLASPFPVYFDSFVKIQWKSRIPAVVPVVPARLCRN